MVLAADLGPCHFVGSGAGGIPLEAAGNGEGDVAHVCLGHAVQAAGGIDLLAGVFLFERIIGFCSIVNRWNILQTV